MLAAICLAAPCFAAEEAPDRVRLEYSAALPSCPDEARFRQLVEAQLEREAFADDAALTLRVRVTRDGDALEGSLSLRSEGSDGSDGGEQRFSEPASRCGELVATMSLAAVIAIERLRQKGQPPRASRAPSRPPSVEVTPPRSGRPPTYRLSTFAGAGVLLGHVPEASPGAAFGLELARDDVRIALHADMLAAAYAEEPAGTVRVQLTRLESILCYSKWSLAACGVFAAGSMSGTGVDTSRSRIQRVFFPAVGIRAGWRRPFGHVFELQVDAGPDFALSRPIVALRSGAEAADIWQPSLLGFSLTVGIATWLVP